MFELSNNCELSQQEISKVDKEIKFFRNKKHPTSYF